MIYIMYLQESETNKSPFENNQEDIFTISHILTLGTLHKCRVWHDNKGTYLIYEITVLARMDTQ